jgi:ArsR family transcriptional regulator
MQKRHPDYVDNIRLNEYCVPHMNEQSFFESLSDETRRRILVLILKQEELCVCELYQALDMLQPKVSRHLGVMRDAELLSMRRDGTWVYYRLHPKLPLWASRILDSMAQAAELEPVYLEDHQRLQAMENRPARCCA